MIIGGDILEYKKATKENAEKIYQLVSISCKI